MQIISIGDNLLEMSYSFFWKKIIKNMANLLSSEIFTQRVIKVKNGLTSLKKILNIEGWAQDYGNSNIFLKPLFRGNLDPFVNNANLGAIAHTSNGT